MRAVAVAFVAAQTGIGPLARGIGRFGGKRDIGSIAWALQVVGARAVAGLAARRPGVGFGAVFGLIDRQDRFIPGLVMALGAHRIARRRLVNRLGRGISGQCRGHSAGNNCNCTTGKQFS